MKNNFAEIITGCLTDALVKSYNSGIRDVVKKAKKKFGAKFAIEIDYTKVDAEALRMFKREAFMVGKIGDWEMQEKLKELALRIWEEYGQNFDEFEKLARNIMLQYIPLEQQMPGGWLQTNYNTAVNSAYKAAEYNRLQEYKKLYPAYEYKTQSDDRVRPEHEELDGKIFKADDPIWDIIYPPNDWNCRCWVDPIDSDEFDPEELTEADENERLILENSVAPDFQRNAGQDKSIWGKWINSKLENMPESFRKELKKNLKEYSKTL